MLMSLNWLKEMKNSATFYLLQTDQFRSHDRCITTLQGIRHVLKLRYNLISLGALREEGFCFSLKGYLMKVFKEAHVIFQAEHVGKVYMLQNLEVTVGGLQLSSASKEAVVEQSETTMVSSSNVQLYPEERLGLGMQQGSPDRYCHASLLKICRNRVATRVGDVYTREKYSTHIH